MDNRAGLRLGLLWTMKPFSMLLVLSLALVPMASVVGCSSSQPSPGIPDSVAPDPAIHQILAVSCYQCHTSEGANEWSVRYQPSRLFGNPALDALNFSEWNSYGAQRRSDLVRQITAVVDAGTMPPAGYWLFHPQARLSAGQKATIGRWAAAQEAAPAH